MFSKKYMLVVLILVSDSKKTKKISYEIFINPIFYCTDNNFL